MVDLARWGIGDEQGRWLRELYERRCERMVGFARRALPPDGRADAEDIVQEVFLEAVVTCGNRSWSLVGDGWLMQRLRSRIADHYRRRERRRRREAAAPAEPPQTVEEVAAGRAAVEELLATIPDPKDRRTLALKLSGYREAEIAALLSVPYQGRQVRDRMQRVRRQVSVWRAAQSAAALEPRPLTDAGRT